MGGACHGEVVDRKTHPWEGSAGGGGGGGKGLTLELGMEGLRETPGRKEARHSRWRVWAKQRPRWQESGVCGQQRGAAVSARGWGFGLEPRVLGSHGERRACLASHQRSTSTHWGPTHQRDPAPHLRSSWGTAAWELPC